MVHREVVVLGLSGQVEFGHRRFVLPELGSWRAFKLAFKDSLVPLPLLQLPLLSLEPVLPDSQVLGLASETKLVMLELRLLLVDQCLQLHFFLFNVGSEGGSLLIE